MGILINIDNGGTFTDVCLVAGEQVVRTKTLTTPYDLTKCFIEVLKAGSKELYGQENLQKLLAETDYIRYSTTAGTNAIVQKKGPRLGLILREGVDPSFLLEGQEEREMFASMVDDRVAGINVNEEQSRLEARVVEAVNRLLSQGANRLVVSLGGPTMVEDEKKIRNIILRKYPRHLLGAVPVLFSHELVEDQDDVKRTWGALINSFLHPGMERFLYNAENVLREYRTKNPMLIFHNDGNSARVAKTYAIKTYGSGPRGGMEGAKALAKHYKIPALLTLDIGGTTSDIGLVKEEQILENVYGEVEGITTSFRLSDLISVGAGGSSIFRVENGKVIVGPESVGAVPGPACFGRGGQQPTITDAYLLMGILDSRSYFGGRMTLDESRARAAIEEKVAAPLGVSLDEALLAMEKAYEQKIAQGLAVYQDKVDKATLLAFGGAGPMSACGAARAAGIEEVIIPRLAAVFSAFGISFSDIAHEYQASLTEWNQEGIMEKIDQLKIRAERDMFAEGFTLSECRVETYLSVVRDGKLEVIQLKDAAEFLEGLEGTEDVQVNLKVVKPIAHYNFETSANVAPITPVPVRHQRILHPSKEWLDVPVYRFEEMAPGSTGSGPALIEDQLFTCRVLDEWTFKVTENKDIFMRDERRKYK
ncbi:hydantoinase/oxoprolinase family protein [Parageobacillus toebii]|uniref:hydantoinase/oxoprolinase family protein n=1 Tax=Parageobacillus toebii TaxID=153151 RepID=UPI001967C737|nr:hydantoinase/oxoprolinase family protein [Parageobacillus toebii]QSB49927.1 hydantoinase/oxoprolinase family protein [Parageobacillus toebii]